MELTIRGKNVKVSDDRKELIVRKLGKLNHYLEVANEATVELATEHSHKATERLVVEMTMWVNGTILRAEERDSDLSNALDRLHAKMQRQMTRYKERLTQRNKGKTSVGEAVTILEEQPALEQAARELQELAPVKAKTFPLKPMYASDAIEELENVGHDFYVFLNAENDGINVVYRRKEGGYGILQPEKA